MNITNPNEVMQKSLEVACAFEQYTKTLDLRDVNVSTDVDYQKNYNSYYRVRRDKAWRDKYFEYMEANKDNESLSFEDILRYLSSIPHKVRKTESNGGMSTAVEASFASKMLATINTDYPVWDSQVVRALEIDFDYSLTGEKKICAYVEAYTALTEQVGNFINTAEGRACIATFDRTFPNHTHLSAFKKIDFFLWNIGK